MWRVLFALVLPASSWACEPDPNPFSCKADESHFSIVVDSVQTTLSRDEVKVFVQQLPNHQSATIQNLTTTPLYTISEHPQAVSESYTPYIVRDKRKWFFEGRYTSSPTSCVPKLEKSLAVKNPEKLDWDCAEQEICGKIYNTNILYLPPDQYPLEWAANGLVRGKISLPKTLEQKFTQYFLHENKIEKVSLISTVSLNEDYLKVTCDETAKIESCGKGCASFANLAVAMKNPASAKFMIKTDERDFSDFYEVELFVDQDFKSRLVDAGAIFVKNSIRPISEMEHYGDLRERPIDYVTMILARAANDDLIPIVGRSWKFNLQLLPAKRVPASHRKQKSRHH